jgi:histidinol dehydrogenase
VIRRLDTGDSRFGTQFVELLEIDNGEEAEVREVVARILKDVKQRGDTAVLEYTEKFDGLSPSTVSELEVPGIRLEQAYMDLDPLVKEALESAAERIRSYHEKQKQALGGGEDWTFEDVEGNELGQRVRGMSHVGIYAPGGKAAYPSTVLMTGIPARVAGVGEITLVVPTPGGQVNEVLLAAAYLAGVDRVYTIGGAQAIAALAYGTQTIHRVDKIVGPGNIYVATAKAMVFGDVGIDMVAGPSEIVIVADESANIDWLVMDMFAQAEHDEMAQAILVSTNGDLLDEIESRLEEAINKMVRKNIIKQSLATRGALIKVDHLKDAADIVNKMAPEHLEIALRAPEQLLELVHNAGAVFIGNHSAEVVGDYMAGPSHVLPTGGTARFTSPLGVYDFQVRTSTIHCSARGSVKLSRDSAILAEQEGLHAHAESARYRVQG